MRWKAGSCRAETHSVSIFTCALAAEFEDEILKSGPEDKPWGMYEFALSDPDETLVRVGWPTRLRRQY